MRTFQVILVYPKTGKDSYLQILISRRSFAELAIELENLGINDVTENYKLRPNDSVIPAEFLLPR